MNKLVSVLKKFSGTASLKFKMVIREYGEGNFELELDVIDNNSYQHGGLTREETYNNLESFLKMAIKAPTYVNIIDDNAKSIKDFNFNIPRATMAFEQSDFKVIAIYNISRNGISLETLSEKTYDMDALIDIAIVTVDFLRVSIGLDDKVVEMLNGQLGKDRDDSYKRLKMLWASFYVKALIGSKFDLEDYKKVEKVFLEDECYNASMFNWDREKEVKREETKEENNQIDMFGIDF